MRIHPLSCGFGFAFLIETSAGMYLVDSGSPANQDRVLNKMKKLGRDDLKAIWITHAHYDHYGSASALREITGAPIGVHPADAESMAGGDSPLGSARGYGFVCPPVLSLISRFQPLPAVSPDFTLQDGETLERFGLEASILHTPGHTAGHTCLLLGQDTAIAGDLIGRAFGASRQRLLAEDWALIPESIDRLKLLDPERVYTGHSPDPITRQALENI